MTKATKPPKAIKVAKVQKMPKTIKATTNRKPTATMPPAGAEVLDRLWATVTERRSADPEKSHSARLLLRGTAKVAQKFGEEAVECLIEAVANNSAAVITESADVLYHLTVLWVATGVDPGDVWAELKRREGVSGIAEKAARATVLTRKIP